MHRLDERDTRLAEMDHAPFLRVVNAVLDQGGTRYVGYGKDERLLYVDADRFAQECVERARRGRLSDPVRPGTGYARVVTLNASEADRNEMRAQVRAVRAAVQTQLEAVAERHDTTLRDLAASLAHPLRDDQRARDELETDAHLLHQDLATPIPVYRQRLSLEHEGMPGAGTGKRKKVFRWHKVLFSIEHSDFDGQMRAALERCIEDWTDDEDEREDLRADLERLMAVPTSRLYALKKVVDTQTIGQIKKEAQIRYLEFLATAFESGHTCRILLQDLARRLRLIQRFVHDASRAEGDYEVSYLNQPYNYRMLLSPADVFEALPVIPRVEGHLGEVTGEVKRERLYTFGLRLKLNGAVQSEGRLSSYQFHVAHLAGQHPARPERKLLLLFLYSVVFDRLGDLKHDPLAAFERQVLPVLRGSDNDAKTRLLDETHVHLQSDTAVSDHLRTLVDGLRDKLRRGYLPPRESYPVHISVLRGVLDPGARQRGADPFFREKLFEKTYRLLSCIDVTDAATSANVVYKLRAEIRFDTMAAYELPDARHTFTMGYLQQGQGGCAALRQLPIVFGPSGRKLREEHLAGSSGLILSTRHAEARARAPSSADDFVYRYAYSLLAWLVVHTIVALAGEETFVPVVRFHQTPEAEGLPDDRFVATMGKVLAHLLGHSRLSSSQGFSIADRANQAYRLKNARSSLYAPLPKVFHGAAPGADDDPTSPQRCAILVVSSRACDDVAGDDASRVLTITGESIGLVRMSTGAVKIQRLRTITGSYTAQRAFSAPTTVLDEVQRLYGRGYRHILYVAQAPYTSTLHLTATDDDEHLFFMSKAIIRQFKAERDDLVVYPVFFGKYPAVEYRGDGAAPPGGRSGRSLYIQDTRELLSLVRDPAKQIAVFLNLFTGATLRGLGETLYNEVISYATLVNVYRDIIDDHAISAGLLTDRDGGNSTKNALVLYLTLLHFARYEVDTGTVVIKLDPYTGIIGDDSVGKHATIPHWVAHRSFNMLAFLHDVEQTIAAL